MDSLEEIIKFHDYNEVYFFKTKKRYTLFEEIDYVFPDGEEGKFMLYKFIEYIPRKARWPCYITGYSCVRIDGAHNPEFRKNLARMVAANKGYPGTLPGIKLNFEPEYFNDSIFYTKKHRFYKTKKNPTKKDLYWRAEFAKPDSLATPQSLIDLENKFMCADMIKGQKNAWDYLGIDDNRYCDLQNRMRTAELLWEIKK